MPTAAEEQQFMASLLDGIADEFFSAPSPSPSPVKRLPPPRSTATPSAPPAALPVTPVKRRAVTGTKRTPKTARTLAAASPAQAIDVNGLLDGADDWDWDDMLTPKKDKSKRGTSTQAPVLSNTDGPIAGPSHVKDECTRCIIESVDQRDYDEQYQKNVTVLTDPGRQRRSVILRDDWAQLDIRPGDVVNVLGSFAHPISGLPLIIITAHANLLIHHPDLLLTATSISTAPECSRRPLLAALVRSNSDTSPALLWGNILHEVMQRSLREGTWEQSAIDARIDGAVQESLGGLVKLGIDVKAARRELKIRAKGLKTFAEKYISPVPKPDAVLSSTRSGRDNTLLAIPRLLDVEEDIWSPTYGLKGKLDASVETVIGESSSGGTYLQKHMRPAPPPLRTAPMPLEIKTGRATAGLEHRAQTMLYTLLMSERYGMDISSGLLYYTQSEEVLEVPRARNELRGLMMARNDMAAWMMRRMSKEGSKKVHKETEVEEAFLPATIDDERICKRCYTLDTCMLYRKAVENVVDTSSPIADTYELKTSHLTPSQCAFFKQWESLIALEEQDLIRFRKELWTMGAPERERVGRCFASMVLIKEAPPATVPGTLMAHRIHQFTYRFARSRMVFQEAGSLLSGHMSAGDAVTVSIEPDLLALVRGFIVELHPEEVVIGVDHEVNVPILAARARVNEDQLIFRIDKDELFGGMGRIRDNLTQLFYASGDTKRLELVVDLKPPQFVEEDSDKHLDHVAADLNTSQKRAIAKVLSAQDYAIILGMPGTGKTTVIAAVIRLLVHMGKTVLLTSYTHSAVDTILLKLKDDADFGILRLGNVDKVHPGVLHLTQGAKSIPETIEQLEQQLMTPPVVATTCLSLDNPLFTRRKFDVCIVDEASQITLPTCLGPLRCADKFVLVGDHFQLPPLVRNPRARKGGLDVSLFRRLSDAHPGAVVDLTEQYRMNEDIMLLSNRLIYSDRLRCGSREVAEKSLTLLNPSFLRDAHRRLSCSGGDCWLEQLISPSRNAVFVDTDGVPGRDSRVGDLVQNEVEAALVCQLTEALIGSGVTESQIGIISLYRQQIKLLSHSLQGRRDIEILTADRSQGRDKDCIIISMVRSNDSGQLGELVKDWRRINVAFTRARSKLVIFGSRTTLEMLPLLAEFFELMDARDWVMTLPAGAHLAHAQGASPSSPSRREELDEQRPSKRCKTALAGEKILHGRYILKDVVYNHR